MAGDDTTGTAMRDDTAGTAMRDDTAGTAMRDDDRTRTAVRDDDRTRTAVREDGEEGGDRTAARAGGAAGGATATVDGTSGRALTRGALTGEALKTARARQRDEFGGLNWGSSFFGWLVAVGIAALIPACSPPWVRPSVSPHRTRTSTRSGSGAASRCSPP
jgi:hypothetical protein